MDKFYIIQSLRAADPELGKRVYDNIKDLTRAEYFKVTTKDELLNILDLIRVDLMASPNARGVIHIHCHGNDEGIGIRDDNDKRDFVYWEDLREKFREIYVATNTKPLLSMCSCKGFNVARLVPHFEQWRYAYVTGS